jgi:hypothetical protein
VIAFPLRNGKAKGGGVEMLRDRLAKKARELSAVWTKNTVALGLTLKEARDTFPVMGPHRQSRRPGWHEWVKMEVGFPQTYVNKLIRVADKFSALAGGIINSDGSIALKALELLASPSTPPTAEKEIIKKARSGAHITGLMARAIVKKHRARNGTLPPPKQANALARKYKAVVPGNDGRYHGGFTKAEEAEYDKKLNLMYGFWEAVSQLVKRSSMTPREFFRMCDENPLWIFYREHDSNIRIAQRWLTAVLKEWKKRPHSKRFSKGKKRRGPPIELIPLADIWSPAKVANGRAR